MARPLFEDAVLLSPVQSEFLRIDHRLLLPYFARVLLPRGQLEVPCLRRGDYDLSELLVVGGREELQKLVLAVLGRSG